MSIDQISIIRGRGGVNLEYPGTCVCQSRVSPCILTSLRIIKEGGVTFIIVAFEGGSPL